MTGKSGRLNQLSNILLSAVVTAEVKPTLFSITRKNRERAISIYASPSSGHFQQEATSKKFVKSVDSLVMDTGEIDLHPTTFLLTDATTGAATANSNSSGLYVDMEMCGIAYTRKPRVINKPYDGGGQKAIVDAIFINMMDNPLGTIQVNSAPQ